jgi:hypothetical protein
MCFARKMDSSELDLFPEHESLQQIEKFSWLPIAFDFVGKNKHILPGFDFSDPVEQSIEFSFCRKYWDVILFS